MFPETDSLIAFIIASVALAVTPGPDMAYVISESVRRGARSGFYALAGINLGCLVHIMLASIGVTALVVALPGAFTVLKLAGALYLLYTAYQLVTARDEGGNTAKDSGAHNSGGGLRVARRGMLIDLLNPKVGLFFLAFLPQFINPDAGSTGLQSLCLGLLFSLIANMIVIPIVLVAAYSSRRITAGRRTGKYLRWFAGTVLGGFAVRLGLSEVSG